MSAVLTGSGDSGRSFFRKPSLLFYPVSHMEKFLFTALTQRTMRVECVPGVGRKIGS